MNVIAVAVIPLIVALAGVVIALSERSDKRIREQMSEMKSRFERMDDRFTQLERHMTDRFDRVDARIDRLYDRSA